MRLFCIGGLNSGLRLMDRSCGPRLQNLVLSREKRNFAAPDALGCEKSWSNVFDRLVTPLRLPGEKLWVDLVKSFGSKLVASHGGERFAFSSRRLWKKWIDHDDGSWCKISSGYLVCCASFASNSSDFLSRCSHALIQRIFLKFKTTKQTISSLEDE